MLRARASTSGTTSPHGGGQAQRALPISPGGLRRRSRLLSIAVLVLVALAAPLPGARADDYSDPAYLQHDIDNVSRALASGRQVASLLDPEYAAAFAPAAAETFLTNLGRQVADAPRGRVYATLGQLLPGGAIGDPLEQIGRHTSELQSLMRISYAVFCLKKKQK